MSYDVDMNDLERDDGSGQLAMTPRRFHEPAQYDYAFSSTPHHDYYNHRTQVDRYVSGNENEHRGRGGSDYTYGGEWSMNQYHGEEIYRRSYRY